MGYLSEGVGVSGIFVFARSSNFIIALGADLAKKWILFSTV